MKILHVIAQLPTRTGSGVYYSNVVEELKRFGHNQAALFAVQDGLAFDILPAEAQYPVPFKSQQLPFPVAGMSDVMPYDNTVYSEMDEGMMDAWQKAFGDTLAQAKKGFAPDIVILHHLWMLTSMAVEVFDSQVKIGICHNTDLRQAEQNPHMKNKYVKNLNSLDAIFSLSDDAKDRIVNIFGINQSKIITIGGGFNQNLFYPAAAKEKSDKIQIVFAAKIERSKGVFELVKAFKGVSAVAPNLHLNIVGTPDGENKQRLASLMEGHENISLVHITSQKVLADFMRSQDIFVMPSYYEGLGLIAIESLGSGLRVVATEIEALMTLLGEDVNNSGIIEYV
ncbi:MAG: glycosyltransferase family 4 protein, partial [Defluviitaleaceae bacterium]|nr:glycosyltransferase family 4 protein [Defluviitaleaceae bacterium]